MTFEQYLQYFEEVLAGKIKLAPYDEPEMLHYTKMNFARMNRWLKIGIITEDTSRAFSHITKPQQWLLITEPWCGDAAHSVPFIYLLSKLSPAISLHIQLRDSEGSEIGKYLTNGSKSIPMLVARNENGGDIFVWGPRPADAQAFFLELKAKNTSYENIKLLVQNWYNDNKGKDIQQEIASQVLQNV